MAQHLSIRIPWKDNGYSGLICEQPCLNNACLRLKNIVSNSVVKDLSQYDVDMGCEANDKKAREEYMVLQAKIREHEIVAFEAGEAQGEANQIVAMVERKMKFKNMTCEEAMDDLDCTPKERQAYYDYVAKSK